MSELPDRVHRAFRDHDSFERRDDGTYESTTTVFDGRVRPHPGDDGQIRFDVTVSVPMLNEVTEGHVADVVEAGWYETFELRVADLYGVTKVDRDLSPETERADREATVSVEFADINERRGVDDSGAIIDFVEGTYVQGIIPGYEYTEPVTALISRGRRAAGAE